jgi:hypothetical protein
LQTIFCRLSHESALCCDAATRQRRWSQEDLKRPRRTAGEAAGKRIELTTKEFALLEYLMLNAGRRVSRPMIIEHVWNLSFDTSTNVVDVYVNYGLRVTEVLAGPQLAAWRTYAQFANSLARCRTNLEGTPLLQRTGMSRLAPSLGPHLRQHGKRSLARPPLLLSHLL